MGLLKKLEMYQKENVGLVALVEIKLPFRLLTKSKYDKIMFRPEFAGAKWYNLSTRVDLEKLLDSADAYSAMAYLRSLGDFEKLP